MKKIKFIILASVLMFGSLSSCDKTLDINTDPLAASSADPNAVLPFVQVQYSTRKTTELGTRISDVSQYWSNTFNSPNRGNTSIFLTGNTWGMFYQQVLGNLSLVKTDAAEAGETSNNVNAIATIMMAHIFYEATSIWEEVPFSEALNGAEFPFPQFDSQETVLNGVVAMYDEAIALIDAMPATGNFAINSSSDQYYGGNIDNWRILANSLKLRALMMLRNGGASVDSQITATLGQPLMETNDQACFVNYSGDAGAQNGQFTIITAFFGPDNESTNTFAHGDPIDELLRDSGDPRWELWVARRDLPAPGNDIFPGAGNSLLSNNILRADLPDMLMKPSEIDLYKAQLAFEGVSAAGDAETNYKNGVTNSLKWWGQDIPGVLAIVSDGAIDAYVNSLGSPTIDDIYNQQYLAAFFQPVMAWNVYRINKVPALLPPPNSSIGTILRRFNYPPDEIGSNPNTPSNKPTGEPMWFEN